jgi:hypothetical protein
MVAMLALAEVEGVQVGLSCQRVGSMVVGARGAVLASTKPSCQEVREHCHIKEDMSAPSRGVMMAEAVGGVKRVGLVGKGGTGKVAEVAALVNRIRSTIAAGDPQPSRSTRGITA